MKAQGYSMEDEFVKIIVNHSNVALGAYIGLVMIWEQEIRDRINESVGIRRIGKKYGNPP